MKERLAALIAMLALLSLLLPPSTYAWSNGGFSADPSGSKYGTHDWIAEHALDWVPLNAKQWIVENMEWFLYGTEIPDNADTPFGIGDTQLHHVYYSRNGRLLDDSAARRANETFYQALQCLLDGNYKMAAVYAGAMAHYISDVAVFGHVMGRETDWGAEAHHEDFERYVNLKTSSYASDFNAHLVFDGDLLSPPSSINYKDVFPPGAGRIYSWAGGMLRSPAYYAALWAAFDTTFDLSGGNRTCKWMDENYDWSSPAFVDRVGQLLSRAVNMVSDALYALYLKYQLQVRGLSEEDIVFITLCSPVKDDAVDSVVTVDGAAFNSGSVFMMALRSENVGYAFAPVVRSSNADKRYVLQSVSYVFRSDSGIQSVPYNGTGVLRLSEFAERDITIDAFYVEEFKCKFLVKGLGEDAVGTVMRIYAPNIHAEYVAQDFPVELWLWHFRVEFAQSLHSTTPGKLYRLKGNYTTDFVEVKEPVTVSVEYEEASGGQQAPQIPLIPHGALEASAIILLLAIVLLILRRVEKKLHGLR